MTLRERFEQYVSPEPMSGCWLWTGGTNGNGYGRFFIGSATHRMAPATRVAWENEGRRRRAAIAKGLSLPDEI